MSFRAWNPPDECPLCGAPYSGALKRCRACAADVFKLHSLERIARLEELLGDVLPLAQTASCRHQGDHGHATACCDWAELVERIRGAGIEAAMASEAER